MLVFLGIFILAFTGSVWNDPCGCHTDSESGQLAPYGKHPQGCDLCGVKPEKCCCRGEHKPTPPPTGCNCGLNEVCVECGSACQPTCEKPEPGPCIAVCISPGCECRFGYIRDKNGKCVEPSECPGGAPKCPANETYTICKSACDLNMTTAYCPGAQCFPPDPFHNASQLPPCIQGCVCLDGYLRRKEDDQCVYRYDCPPESTTENCETTTTTTTTESKK